MKPKTVTTIKYIGILLFLICVFQKPQEASAQLVDHGYGFAFDVYEDKPNDTIVSVLSEHITKGYKNTFAFMVETWETHEQYLIFGESSLSPLQFNKWVQTDMVFCKWTGYWWVYKLHNGEWMQTYYYENKGGEQETGIFYQDGKIKIYVFSEWTTTYFYYSKDGKDRTIWSSSYRAPTVTPIPLPTPTPTPVPTVNVDANESGLSELFGFVMRLLNIPFSINGYEVTFLQIFIYIALASGTLTLIFSGSKD